MLEPLSRAPDPIIPSGEMPSPIHESAVTLSETLTNSIVGWRSHDRTMSASGDIHWPLVAGERLRTCSARPPRQSVIGDSAQHTRFRTASKESAASHRARGAPPFGLIWMASEEAPRSLIGSDSNIKK